jgi:hypothetical protein
MMPALCLDYQHRRPGSVWWRAGLLVIGLVAASGALLYERQLAGAIAQHQAELGQIRQRLHPRRVVRADASPRQIEEEVRRAKGVIRQLTLPWDRMFAAIEASDNHGIALLTVQPDADKQHTLIGGEAKSLMVMLEYVQRLERSGALARVHVTTHEVQQQDPQKPVRFMLEADWAVRP